MHAVIKNSQTGMHAPLSGLERLGEELEEAIGLVGRRFQVPPPVQFESLIEEIEQAVGRRLRGEGRIKCIRAFEANPDGFARLTRRALLRARSNPIGLLCRMVDDGEHLLTAITRGAGTCVICDTPTLDALYRGGQWWCPACEHYS